jgi:hypothetical protein
VWKQRLRLGVVGVLVIAALVFLLPSRRDRIILRAIHMIEDHRTTLDALSTRALKARETEKNENVPLFSCELGDVQAPPVELLDSCAFRVGIGSIGLVPGGSAFYIVKVIDMDRAVASVVGTDKRFIFVDGSYGLLEWK